MKKRTETILSFLNVLAWIAFIGLAIKAGALLTAFFISLFNPVAAGDLYQGLDLSMIRNFSLWHYCLVVSLMVAIFALEAYIAFQVTRILSRIKISHPFTPEVAETMEATSYTIIGTWFVGLAANSYYHWLDKRVPGFSYEKFPNEFIFLAGVIFVFAQVFKKGVELQAENDLTV